MSEIDWKGELVAAVVALIVVMLALIIFFGAGWNSKPPVTL